MPRPETDQCDIRSEFAQWMKKGRLVFPPGGLILFDIVLMPHHSGNASPTSLLIVAAGMA
jgi:hypothetical protein